MRAETCERPARIAGADPAEGGGGPELARAHRLVPVAREDPLERARAEAERPLAHHAPVADARRRAEVVPERLALRVAAGELLAVHEEEGGAEHEAAADPGHLQARDEEGRRAPRTGRGPAGGPTASRRTRTRRRGRTRARGSSAARGRGRRRAARASVEPRMRSVTMSVFRSRHLDDEHDEPALRAPLDARLDPREPPELEEAQPGEEDALLVEELALGDEQVAPDLRLSRALQPGDPDPLDLVAARRRGRDPSGAAPRPASRAARQGSAPGGRRGGAGSARRSRGDREGEREEDGQERGHRGRFYSPIDARGPRGFRAGDRGPRAAGPVPAPRQDGAPRVGVAGPCTAPGVAIVEACSPVKSLDASAPSLLLGPRAMPDFKKMTVESLRALARKVLGPGHAKKTKSELVAALEGAGAKPAPAARRGAPARPGGRPRGGRREGRRQGREGDREEGGPGGPRRREGGRARREGRRERGLGGREGGGEGHPPAQARQGRVRGRRGVGRRRRRGRRGRRRAQAGEGAARAGRRARTRRATSSRACAARTRCARRRTR